MDRELNPKIFDYVLSFEFRRNNGPDLWSALGALAQKASKAHKKIVEDLCKALKQEEQPQTCVKPSS